MDDPEAQQASSQDSTTPIPLKEEKSARTRRARTITPGTGKAHGFLSRIRRFSPAWFSVTMGCGIPSVLLFLLPYESSHAAFRGIGAAFLLIDIILFSAFFSMFVARYYLYPAIFPATLRHEQHSLFLGTLPMGYITITSAIALYGHEWGLSGAVMAASVLYWIGSLLACFAVLVVPYMMMTQHSHKVEGITAAWLLPFVPPLTIATSGATIGNLLIDTHPTYALNIVLSSYVQLGYSLLLAMCLLVLYIQRLTLHHLPNKDLIVSTFLPLGPCGQGGYALLALGRLSRDLFIKLSNDDPDSVQWASLRIIGDSMYGAGILAGLLLWGFGMWFLAIASAACASHFLRDRGHSTFNLGFWAFTFPLGSMNLLTFALATTFDNWTFRILGTIMTALVCVLWVVVAVPTARGFKRGTLFQAPCLETMDQKKLNLENEEEAELPEEFASSDR